MSERQNTVPRVVVVEVKACQVGGARTSCKRRPGKHFVSVGSNSTVYLTANSYDIALLSTARQPLAPSLYYSVPIQTYICSMENRPLVHRSSEGPTIAHKAQYRATILYRFANVKVSSLSRASVCDPDVVLPSPLNLHCRALHESVNTPIFLSTFISSLLSTKR